MQSVPSILYWVIGGIGFLVGILVGMVGGYAWIRARTKEIQEDANYVRQRLSAIETSHEERTQRDRKRWGAILDATGDGLVVLDENGRVEFCNEQVEILLGRGAVTPGLLLSVTFRRPEILAILDRPGNDPVEVEVSNETEGKRTLIVSCRELSGVTDRVVTFHDVSRLKQLETLRKEFVANVSHELRTPLTLITGFVETLENGAMADPPTANRFLKIIHRNTERLSFLIEDLLTLSSLESGKVPLSCQPSNLRDIVGAVVDSHHRRAALRLIRVVNEIPEYFHVFADATRIEQVLSNLLDNALKYGRENGQVVIAARTVERGMIEVEVADDGPGIPPEIGERVFERFYRVDPARSRETGGTGLGLAIVKHIVLAHGGEVRLESEVGHGSQFFFTLPAAPEPSTPGDEPVFDHHVMSACNSR